MRNASQLITAILLSGIVAYGCSRSMDSGSSTKKAEDDGGMTTAQKAAAKEANNLGTAAIATLKKGADLFPADERLDPNKNYAAIAKDLMSGQEYAQTGIDMGEATNNAIRLCNVRTGQDNGTCVLVKRFTLLEDVLTMTPDAYPFKEYACVVSEYVNPGVFISRSWVGLGSTTEAAKSAALAKCASKGGIECYITKCVNADYDKGNM
jgi:hypothetical protein